MNGAMIRRLVLKDWAFNRVPLLVFTALGVLSLVLSVSGGDALFVAGTILLVTTVISLGIYLVMTTVIHERTEKTLPFIMSLPVSPMEYTTAKLLANLILFAAPWVVLVLVVIAMVAAIGVLPDGLIPFAIVILGELFVGYALTLAIAIVSEKTSWTIGAIVATNLLFQAFLFALGRNTVVKAQLADDAIRWDGPIPGLILLEVVLVLGLFALTYWLQSRKRDFL